MSDNKTPLDISDLGSALPFHAPVLSDEDRASLVNAIEDKIQRLAGPSLDVMGSLTSKVRKRVEVLQEIQIQHDVLQADFFEERAALEAKYLKLYEPLYNKRFEIVNGEVDVEGNTSETAEETTSDEEATEVKGIPSFWLTAMKTNEVLAEEIQECDEEALKYLKDIKWCKVDDPKGFKLDFFFDHNPFFKNSVLTKTYHMIEDDEPILDKAIGTEIEWLKCLTLKSVKKKPKNGLKKARLITRTVRCESFFNFFKPPQIPEEDTEMDENVAEELQNQLEHDYDVGSTIRDKIIPRAVSWFTGEAVQDEEGEDFKYSDEDDDDDEEEEEENEDEDDGEEEEEEDNEDVDDGEEDYEDGDNEEDEHVESKSQRKSSSGRKVETLVLQESGRAHSGEAQVETLVLQESGETLVLQESGRAHSGEAHGR